MSDAGQVRGDGLLMIPEFSRTVPPADLCADDSRPVQVRLGAGTWVDGCLEAYTRRPDGAWVAWVRYTTGTRTRGRWFTEEELRACRPEAPR